MPSIDVPCLVPSWIMPAWLSDAPTSPREALRRQRLQTLRSELAAARRVPALPLPPPPAEEALGSTAEDGGVDLTHSASNAVPFTTSGSAATTCSGAAAPTGGAAVAPTRADAARQVLPWLFAVEGRLDLSAMETLASQLALSNLQLLDVSRYLCAASAAPGGHWASGWGSHVRWAGPQALPSPAVAAAAALRRMELRRGGALGALPNIDGKAVSCGKEGLTASTATWWQSRMLAQTQARTLQIGKLCLVRRPPPPAMACRLCWRTHRSSASWRLRRSRSTCTYTMASAGRRQWR